MLKSRNKCHTDMSTPTPIPTPTQYLLRSRCFSLYRVPGRIPLMKASFFIKTLPNGTSGTPLFATVTVNVNFLFAHEIDCTIYYRCYTFKLKKLNIMIIKSSGPTMETEAELRKRIEKLEAHLGLGPCNNCSQERACEWCAKKICPNCWRACVI